MTVYGAVLAFFVRDVGMIAAWLSALGVVLTTVSIGMLASIYFPYPFDEESTSRQRSGGGCTTGGAGCLRHSDSNGTQAAALNASNRMVSRRL